MYKFGYVKKEGTAKDVVDFFTSLGFKKFQAIAIAGNLQEESQFKTEALGDNGTAFGLAQWRGSRLNDLKTFARKNFKSYKDFYIQLAFILHEFNTTEKRAFQKFKEATDLKSATLAFAIYYERPQASTYPKRIAYAEQINQKIKTYG